LNPSISSIDRIGKSAMLRLIKIRLYDVLVDTEDNALPDRIVATLLMILILLNGIAVVLETVDELAQSYAAFFHAVEVFSVAVFTMEYLLRLWIAPLDPRYGGRIAGRLRYAATPMAMVDLIAILPAYLPLIFPIDLRMLRFLRIFRLFRLFKMSRYAESLNTLDDVIRAKKEELLVTLLLIAIMLLFSSSIMYAVENGAQPDKFPSIPAALWWGVATLTTIGYGDVYPVTPVGKFLGGVIAFLGIGIFALPTGILATGFAEELKMKRAANPDAVCPHCGGELSRVDAE
jgi:voltage-gated potassium channel